MAESFEPRLVKKSEYNSLKKLFNLCFGDSQESINSFFEKTVSCDNVVAIFDGEKAISSLYLLDAEIINKGVISSAYYVYGVCTHPEYRNKGLMRKLFDFTEKLVVQRNIKYLFLVPEDEHLFKAYEKLGFETGFSYTEKIFDFNENLINSGFYKNGIEYNQYRDFCIEKGKTTTVAVLKERGFNSFFESVTGDVFTITTDDGYCVFETSENNITAFEFFGDVNNLIKVIFKKTNAERITCRCPAKESENNVNYGMYKAFNDADEIDNAFFGIPYST